MGGNTEVESQQNVCLIENRFVLISYENIDACMFNLKVLEGSTFILYIFKTFTFFA